MADHQMLRAGRRRAVVKGADLAIGAADTDLKHAQLHVGRRRNSRLGVIDELNFATLGYDSDGFHARFDAGAGVWFRSLLSRVSQRPGCWGCCAKTRSLAMSLRSSIVAEKAEVVGLAAGSGCCTSAWRREPRVRYKRPPTEPQ